MKEVGFDIPIISLAKREEEVFLPGKEQPIIIPKDNNAIKLLQRIRDESHRFAITFHRQLRNKNTLKSKLDEIDGVGKNKAMALNHKFKSVKNISNASIEELKQVDGIGDKLAKTIYDYFHQGE